VVGGGGEQDAEHHGPRTAIPRREGQSDELGLIAHLGEEDDEKRGPERGHLIVSRSILHRVVAGGPAR